MTTFEASLQKVDISVSKFFLLDTDDNIDPRNQVMDRTLLNTSRLCNTAFFILDFPALTASGQRC